MLSHQKRYFLLILAIVCSLSVQEGEAAPKGLPVSRKKDFLFSHAHARYRHSSRRHLQKNEDDKNVGREVVATVVKDIQGGGKNKETEMPTLSPTTQSPTIKPTTKPTQRPTQQPATSVPTEAPLDESTIPAVTTSDNGITLNMQELRDIQYLGDGTVTVRMSLWFQDGRTSQDVKSQTSPMQQAVLTSMQSLFCQLEDSESDELQVNSNNEALGLPATSSEYVVDTTAFDNTEERELCVVKTELVTDAFQNRQFVEGSILLQPPKISILDRSATDGITTLRWTTWKVTWNVLRLGTFYILQGLENLDLDSLGDATHQDIYNAGIDAMQQVLELALQVSIRENGYDALLLRSMKQVDTINNGVVIASVYGEEKESLHSKLEALGLPEGDLVIPTQDSDGNSLADNNTSTMDPVAESDGWDDDRYSMEYGITESLDPDFWHPLRIAGIVMFFLTTTALVGLSWMSRKRQARRALERKMAKEGAGLLNDHEGVENMLRASERAGEGKDDAGVNNADDDEDDDDDSKIPLPENLKAENLKVNQ